MIRQGLIGEEDCLYLNVYTQELKEDAQKAVMVWFHGGGFNAGSGDDDVLGPDFLLDHDVVVVTMNYRLGAIGMINYHFFLHIPCLRLTIFLINIFQRSETDKSSVAT